MLMPSKVPRISIMAPEPFDRLDADLILRSSDKEPVDFRVFKLFLSLASPFFAMVFTLPQPNQATEQNPPMMMVCGHVISKDSLHKLSKAGG